jgi:hypothetical protein
LFFSMFRRAMRDAAISNDESSSAAAGANRFLNKNCRLSIAGE